MKNIHGGDIYNNKVNMDYSVNINPLGMPDRVKRAMHDAVEHCDRYPDINCDRLRYAVAKDRAEEVLFGNGASELFMAVVHAIKPRQAVIPIPSFYGYEYDPVGRMRCRVYRRGYRSIQYYRKSHGTYKSAGTHTGSDRGY